MVASDLAIQNSEVLQRNKVIMDLSTIKDSFERVAKKQKLSSSVSGELIDQVDHEFEQILMSIQSVNDSTVHVGQRSILNDLKANLTVISSNSHLEGMQREVNINISKLQKALEKSFIPDISKACRNVDFDTHIVNQIIINHFYREGQFDIVDCLLKESGEPEAIFLRLQFQEIHQILKAVKCRNLKPALKWVTMNRERLESGSDLELKLHKLQFVDILQNQSQADALKYAKSYLAPFSSHHMNEVQKLMGSLLWAGKLDKSPYTDLVAPNHWEKLAVEIMQTFFCTLSGQSFQNPLNVALAAGLEGLPTLLKLANVMAAKKQEWQEMKQLPVPVELGKEFQFHSIFVCPVSREQASEENPPMLLPCGHVLCKQSINKLSKANTRSFKCPYCPLDASVAQCKQLYF